MSRLRFFSEMKKGLLETVKAISEPFIEEKVEQLDRATDTILQIKWIPLTDDITASSPATHQYIEGKPVLVFGNGKDIQAVSTICIECTNLLFFSESTSQLACYFCEKTFSLLNGEGDLQVCCLPIRYRNNRYEVGIEQSNKKLI